ncbi:hypothetical protein [Sinomonas sp. ASV322]|uniref:hypothetical protein n=1 Tax=Sinomonas sp. ASV322 TaxID=3041920 RepID=UPI0027DBB9CE|nr:hypothetical protein [Sinomonas sp. ASV322]MDQ4504130.1 hypothetical protein [Sinomonas sp. ASV322]
MPQQYRLSGGSLEAVARTASELYGPKARIVSAERVLDPGFGGLLGRRHVEAMVLVPDDHGGQHAPDGDGGRLEPPSSAPSSGPHTFLAARGGIAALLEEAERAEDVLQSETAEPADGRPADDRPADAQRAEARRADPWSADVGPAESRRAVAGPAESPRAVPGRAAGQAAVSTQTEGFDVVLARLREETSVVDEPVPALLGEPGDLVLVLGPSPAVFDVASSMARSAPQWVCAAVGPAVGPAVASGAAPDWPALTGPRDATAARARAVEAGVAVLAVGTLTPLEPITAQLREALALHPDQVWLAIDARHKPDETADWVDAVAERLPVDALAVVGARETRTAYTVNGLGIPVGWVDGHAAPRTVL